MLERFGARARRGILVAAMAVAGLALGPSAASASTVCAAGCDFTSIQAAVDAGPDNTTISVFAGTYFENVIVHRPVNLQGAQFGEDARDGRPGEQETIMAHFKGAFNIQADNVTIDGFKIQEQTGTDQGAGIVVTNLYSGYTIINNIIRDNHFGLYANSSGTNTSLVQHNLFDDNNRPGAATGNAIYADQGTKNLTIDANKFTNHTNAGILFVHTINDSSLNSGIDVTNNESVNDAPFVFYIGSVIQVNDNTITNNDVGSSLVVGGNVQGYSASGNTVTDGDFAATRVADFLGLGTPASGIEFTGNTLLRNGFGFRQSDAGSSGPVVFSFNRVSGNAVGAANEMTNPVVQTAAQNNWWGCNTGPQAPAPPAIPPCDPVDGNVDASPWLILKVKATPGKIHRIVGTSTITGSLTTNSDGLVPSGNNFPDGTLIKFSPSSDSTVNPTFAPTVNGVATTTLFAGTLTGNVIVKGKLDKGEDKATVKVIP